MARGFRRKRDRLVADLSRAERDVVVSFLDQTVRLLESAAPTAASPVAPVAPAADPFEALMTRAGWTRGVDPAEPGPVATSGPVDAGPWPGRRADADEQDAAPDVDAASPAPGDVPGDQVHDDPALRRLLPDAHRDDPDLARQFRRLSGDNVRTRKVANLVAAATALRACTGDRVSLTADEGQALLVGLTDVRLVLAERLGIHTDDDAEHLEAQTAALAEGDERAQAMLVYDFLTWFQETLASALLG